MYIVLTTLNNIHWKLLYFLMQQKSKFHIGVHSAKPSENARCRAIKTFLSNPEYGEWIFFIDYDTVPPINILDLVKIAEKKDIKLISGLSYMVYNDKIVPMVLKKYEDGQYYPIEIPENELIEADATGAGCLFIHREVLKKFRNKGVPPFHREYTTEGIVLKGEDIWFFERAKEFGYKCYVHTGFKCSHYKVVDLKELFEGKTEIFPDDNQLFKYIKRGK